MAAPGHDGPCDVEVQCAWCWAASEQQYDAWFGRAGRRRSHWRLVINEMRDDAHAEALAEDRARSTA